MIVHENNVLGHSDMEQNIVKCMKRPRKFKYQNEYIVWHIRLRG